MSEAFARGCVNFKERTEEEENGKSRATLKYEINFAQYYTTRRLENTALTSDFH